MKASHIRALVSIAILALVGLISIQVYWIGNAIDTKREDLQRSATEAIHEVAELLEKHETLTKLKSHEEAKYLFVEESFEGEPILPPQDSLIEFVVRKNIEKSGDQLEMRITEEQDGTTKESVIKYSAQDIPFTLDFEQDLQIKLIDADSHQPYSHGLSEPIAKEMDSLRHRLVTKRTFLGDIVKSLIEVNLNERIEERIDPKVLDSLIQLALQRHGIEIDFAFGVYERGETYMFGNGENTLELENTAMTARLFPNDVIQQPYFIHLDFPGATGYLLRNLWLLLGISLLFMIAISSTSYYTVLTIIRQKKNSAIKNDFINNMTHELKTPISTISLACEALSDPELSKIENIKNRYIGIINAENKRLGLLVEEVLQSAVLDKGDFKLKKVDLDVHELLRDVADKFQIQIKERKGALHMELKADSTLIEGDKNHLVNVIYNLLDNATKYSKDEPNITISTTVFEDKIRVAVADKGIGIDGESLKKVFDRLYRVPTGNVHNVKGFGLGLSYVKIITERHGGAVHAKSKLGTGSTFTIELPLKQTMIHGEH